MQSYQAPQIIQVFTIYPYKRQFAFEKITKMQILMKYYFKL